MESAFDLPKYKKLQTEEIVGKLNFFDRLYLEVGGKLFDDKHAARVIPGFEPDVKIQILKQLSADLEVVFCINAEYIKSGRTRYDNGLSYCDEVLRLIKKMREQNLLAHSVVITFYSEHPKIAEFEKECAKDNIDVYKSYFIEGYPENIDKILSNDGFGKNDYVNVNKRIVLVAAPGANCGKMQTCMNQIFHDKQRGLSSGYAKFETFPVWNLPLDHLANVAYEMSTADIGDENQIDPFHKTAFGEVAVNYNRDIEAFPVLSSLLSSILGKSVYKSPTEMGINNVGLAITNDAMVQRAAFHEIEVRYEKIKADFKCKKANQKTIDRADEIMRRARKIYNNLFKNKV